ncbi:hypothetical protein C0Q70_15403 [Pomacea canaliculata]|uniref:Uncharacterized protein n=1 Tax=Pomacea canaliculata TaxID=400727 RepID=A0A2T7NUQ6_POMCA|nr:hypothetical protein C0Q70_15403 [Pomacea canaliculata]
MFTKSLGKEEERQMLAHLAIHAVLSAARAAPFVREQVCSRRMHVSLDAMGRLVAGLSDGMAVRREDSDMSRVVGSRRHHKKLWQQPRARNRQRHLVAAADASLDPSVAAHHQHPPATRGAAIEGCPSHGPSASAAILRVFTR